MIKLIVSLKLEVIRVALVSLSLPLGMYGVFFAQPKVTFESQNNEYWRGGVDNKVTSIDRPRCSQCKKFKSDDELNGYNPFAPTGQKYKAAYCRDLAQCDSDEARETLYKVVDEYQDSLNRDPETE